MIILEKTLLRAQCKNLVLQILPSIRTELDARLVTKLLEFLGPYSSADIGYFLPLVHEPSIQKLWKNQDTIFIPGYDQGQPTYRLWNLTPQKLVHKGSLSYPHDSCPIGAPKILLVPFVGFNNEGFRLGHGGGFFDRYLYTHPHVISVGIGYDEQLINFTPCPHDQRLTTILTPTCTFNFE